MTTLHRVTEATKKILIGFAIGIASIIFISLSLRFLVTLKEYFFPTPEAAPTVTFGKLPPIPFPQSVYTDTYTYTLNTISGTLPNLPNRATVYKLIQPQPNLLNFDAAKKLAAANGYDSDPTQLSDTVYTWKQTAGLQQKLTFDIVSNDFSVSSPTNYLADQDVLNANYVPQEKDAISLATSFFQNFSALPDDIDLAKTRVTYFTISNGVVIPAESFSSSQVVFVDFYQKDVNNLPILYPDFPVSLIHTVIASGKNHAQIEEASFAHKAFDTTVSGTYPLKTVAQAYTELKQQKAYIANYDAQNKNITIRNAFLGYYIGKDPQLYLYPVIVFQGDNNFYAFVPAITDEWTQK